MPFFSVIIPVYNRAHLLAEALTSVFAQTFTDYEVIVVDDGSTEEIAALVAGCQNGVRFFRQENGGPGTARNLGVEKARGEYVVFLDGDDVWFPWTLASYHEVIHQGGHPGFIAGNCLKFAHAGELKGIQRNPLQYKLFADYFAAFDSSLEIVGCAVAVKRSFLATSGGFLKGHVNAEDSDMWMKLGSVPGFAQLISPVICGYRQTSSSVSRSGAKTIAGIKQMVLAEKAGQYPGGRARQRERWRVLTFHLRPASLGCIQEGHWRDAWWFYEQSFWWHVSLWRVKYLMVLPLLYLRGWLRSGWGAKSATLASP